MPDSDTVPNKDLVNDHDLKTGVRVGRRAYLKGLSTSGVGLSLAGMFHGLSGCAAREPRNLPTLREDPAGICDLPEGFTYKVISTYEDMMSDGHTVPDYFDGMGCFARPDGGMILVRNHEISTYFPFDPPSPEPEQAYDPKSSGGTVTIWLNERLEVERQYLSLTGTIRNCSGGQSPWGTWISCEEAAREGWMMGKRHGYAFEVDPQAPLTRSEPIKGMGRFNHEAVAFDFTTGIVYQTEDADDGCFYRYIPHEIGNLLGGGRLQALKFDEDLIRHTTLDTLELGRAYRCSWVDILEPDPEDDTVRLEAQSSGAAVFVRGEGMASAEDGIYFSCCTGGQSGLGQVFRYEPGTSDDHGEIELVYVADNDSPFTLPDNLTFAPWGDLIICEDSPNDRNCLAGLTPDGEIYLIAANSQSEWAGACFSPDGQTLFANIHKKPGMTVAIQGPWDELRNSS